MDSASENATTASSLKREVTAATVPLRYRCGPTLDDEGAEQQHEVDDRNREERARPARAGGFAQAVASPTEKHRPERPGPHQVGRLFDADRREQQADRNQREEIAHDAVLGGA